MLRFEGKEKAEILSPLCGDLALIMIIFIIIAGVFWFQEVIRAIVIPVSGIIG